MNLCSKCKKRPAMVFISDPSQPNAQPQGLCLVCAKEMGVKPINDMLEKMNITDDDIEQLSEQFSDIMSMGENGDDEGFDLGTAPAFPFLNNIFGGSAPKSESGDSAKGEKGKDSKKGNDKKRKRHLET